MLERLVPARVRAGVRNRASALVAALTPEAVAARGITRAARLVALVLGGFAGLSLHLGFGWWLDVLVGALLGWLLTGLGELTFGVAKRIVATLDRGLGLGGAAALLASVTLLSMFALPPLLALFLAFVAIGSSAVLGASVSLLLVGDPRRGRLLAGGGAAVVVLVALAVAAWWSGDREDPTLALVPSRAPAPAAVAQLLERGPYEVAFLTYGSGTDRRRSEFREAVAFTTEPVDGSALLTGLSGWKASVRARVWGFGSDRLPLNARVWYPRALDQPAPLVLVVHGNHNMLHYSDPGYAWIGEHLASRGFVVASIDQNFLNSGPFVGGTSPENDARGWLLLEHLAQWRKWNADPAHPFHQRLDLDRVVLIGHSRGGEAVGHAAAFNRLAFYPDDANVTFDYDFGLRGVVAIAPSDGQYQPSGKRTPIEDVSYLAIQGGYDADVSLFLGDRQYQRVRFDPDGDHFKATLWLHHANHGQFNTVWGRRDLPAFASWLLRLAPLLEPEDQRRAGLLFITAFVEERLHDRTDLDRTELDFTGLRDLFRDPERAGALLPPTLVAGRFEQAGHEVLADFESGLDLAVGSQPGVAIATTGLVDWAENDLRLRGKTPRGDTAQVLGWRRGEGDEPPTWTLLLPADLLELEAVTLDLAQLDQDPKSPDRPDDTEDVEADDKQAEEEPPALRAALAFSIELVDAAGTRARLPLSDFGTLLPPLPVRHTKLGWLDRRGYINTTEPLPQTFLLPLEVFANATPGFDRTTVRELRLIFDASPEGVLAISNVGAIPRSREA